MSEELSNLLTENSNQEEKVVATTSEQPQLSGKEAHLEKIRQYEKENEKAEREVKEPASSEEANKPVVADNNAVVADKPDTTVNTDIPTPKSWNKEKLKDFHKVPEDIRNYIIERDREVASTLGKDSELKHVGKRIVDTLQDYGVDFDKGNLENVVNEFGYYKRAEKVLSSPNMLERAMFVNRIIQTYGIDMGVLNQDPNLLHYAHQNMTLAQQQEQQQIEINRQLREQQRQLEEYNQAENKRVIEEFKKSAPDLDLVANEVAELLRLPKYQGMDNFTALQTAYNEALYLNPSTRQKVMDKEFRTLQAQKNREAQERLSNARNAASSVRSSSGASSGDIGSSNNPKQALKQRIASIMNNGE